MPRLTRWNGKRWILPQGAWREITERLAAYENTGLEPGEVEALRAASGSLTQPNDDGLHFSASYIVRGHDCTAPFTAPDTGSARISTAVLKRWVDNPEVLQEPGAIHLVIEVYRDHWHVIQVNGYTLERGCFSKIY